MSGSTELQHELLRVREACLPKLAESTLSEFKALFMSQLQRSVDGLRSRGVSVLECQREQMSQLYQELIQKSTFDELDTTISGPVSCDGLLLNEQPSAEVVDLHSAYNSKQLRLKKQMTKLEQRLKSSGRAYTQKIADLERQKESISESDSRTRALNTKLSHILNLDLGINAEAEPGSPEPLGARLERFEALKRENHELLMKCKLIEEEKAAEIAKLSNTVKTAEQTIEKLQSQRSCDEKRLSRMNELLLAKQREIRKLKHCTSSTQNASHATKHGRLKKENESLRKDRSLAKDFCTKIQGELEALQSASKQMMAENKRNIRELKQLNKIKQSIEEEHSKSVGQMAAKHSKTETDNKGMRSSILVLANRIESALDSMQTRDIAEHKIQERINALQSQISSKHTTTKRDGQKSS